MKTKNFAENYVTSTTAKYVEGLGPTKLCIEKYPAVPDSGLKRGVSIILLALLGLTNTTAKQPNNIDDYDDMTGDGAASAEVDITRWMVSEPYINLWLLSRPMAYHTSYGGMQGATVAYRPRQGMGGFFGFGDNWGFNWRAFINYSVSETNVTWSGYYLPVGGRLTFTPDGTTHDWRTRCVISTIRNGTNGVTGFLAQGPGGGRQILDYTVNVGTGQYTAYLTQDIDPNNRTNVFQYEVVSSGPRLIRVIDSDNRTNTIRYAGASSLYVTEIESPYGRKANFGYDGSNRLITITNVIGMVDTISYDGSNQVTNLVTGYGTTRFEYVSQSFGGYTFGGTNQINRSVLVTEPTGDRELFLYRDDGSKLYPGSSVNLLPSSYATNQVPVTSPLASLFDNSYLDTRNSFHWSKMQFGGLSATFTNALSTFSSSSFNSMNTNDYNLSSVKHWMRWPSDGTWVYPILSFMRNPSPNGTNEGQKVWYDYAGKSGTYPWCAGTNATPLFEAVVLPDGNSRFKYTEHNQWDWPTKITTTYTSNNVVAQRSLTLAYASNDIDQLTMRGPSNELLSSNAFNSAHQVLTNYNAVNDLTTYTYDSGARLTSVKAPTGLTTTNSYYTNGTHIGWLQQKIDLEIARTNGFGYTNGEVSAQTNALGLVVTYTRDSMDRILEVHSPSLNLTNTYDKLQRATVANGNSTNRYVYDAFGRVSQVIDPRNNTNSYFYCGCGFMLTNINPLQNFSSFEHDWLSRRTEAVLPDRNTTVQWNYDLLGQMTNMAVVGLTSVTNYMNNQGLLSISSNALGQISSVLYDVYDRSTNVTDVNGITIQTTYDLLGRSLTKTYPDGGLEKWAYVAAGVSLYTNQLGQITKYGYDAAGRLTAVTNANAEVTRYVYDAEGNQLQLIDGKNQTNSFTFDAYSRLIRQTNAAGSAVLTNGYDSQGNLTKRWTPAKGLTTLAYDQSGNVTNVDYPTSHDLSFTYDGMNNVIQMVDAVGTTGFAYDKNGNVLYEDGPWPASAVIYSYTNGLRLSMALEQPSGAPIAYNYNYDVASRLSSITSPFGKFGYSYQTTDASNGKGSLIQKISFPNASYVTNSFNNMGQLLSTYLKSSVHQTLNSHSYTYNVGAQRTRQTRTSGDYVDYTYDSIGQLATATGKESGGGTTRLHEKFGYAYDAANNLQNRTNNALIQTFSVDSLNQVSSISRSGNFTLAGNSSATAPSLNINGAAATLYTDNSFAKDTLTLTNGSNSYTSIGSDSSSRSATNTAIANLPSTVSATYDSNGNLLTEGDRRYTYDDENQLVAFGYNGGTTTNIYSYDGRNRRRIKTEYVLRSGTWVKTAEVRYIYDGSLVVQERNADNLPLATYSRGLDLSGSILGAGGVGGLLARTEHTFVNRRTDYYHQDGNGNVTFLADQRDGLAARYAYDPYGRVIARSGSLSDANRMQFSGKECDSLSGLSYYGKRYYSPPLQRWINLDPKGFGNDVNLFAFVHNRPINSLDPNGEDACAANYNLFFDGVARVVTTVGGGILLPLVAVDAAIVIGAAAITYTVVGLIPAVQDRPCTTVTFGPGTIRRNAPIVFHPKPRLPEPTKPKLPPVPIRNEAPRPIPAPVPLEPNPIHPPDRPMRDCDFDREEEGPSEDIKKCIYKCEGAEQPAWFPKNVPCPQKKQFPPSTS